LACYRIYRARDGRHLAVGALEPRFWRTLCESLGLPELVHEQFAGPERQEEIAARLQEAFSSRERDEWVTALGDLDACVGPVNDVAEALSDPQLAHRGLLAEAGGRRVGPGPAVKVSGHDPGTLAPAPALGEHTEEVLSDLGSSLEEIEKLRSSGVV
jgi:alpha-methylacyl-CoA racemase